MPNYPKPKWFNDPVKTKQFQDWVNGVYPGAIDVRGGVGKFGPRTTAAWDKYGQNYEKIYNALSPDMKKPVPTTPVSTVKQTTTATNTTPVTIGAPAVEFPSTAKNMSGSSNWMKVGLGINSAPTTKPKGTGNFMAKGAEVAKAAAPFISNIVNSFRKPPMPRQGKSYNYTPLTKVNLSDERNQISSIYQAGNRAADRNVDGNTAEAIKAFNRGEEISKLSAVNEREANLNTQISNTQAQMDAQVSAANTGLVNKFQDETVERQVVNQREQSANWANAGDKFMMIQNEKSKEATELGKARVLRSAYDKSGVLKRDNAMGQKWKTSGIPDPFGEDYKWLDEVPVKKSAMGGMLIGPGVMHLRKLR